MRLLLTLWLLASASVYAQPGQSEFVPVTEIPPSEQLPAAPLVIAAYAFVWAAFIAYTWTMWRKVTRVEQELRSLSTRIARKAP